jgi:hypothetical protein
LHPKPSHEWKARRRRTITGDMTGHVRFLQHWYRRAVRQRPGCWRRGGLRGLVLWRPCTFFACHSGLSLAADSTFEAGRRGAQAACAWYQNYVALLRRLRAGRRPTAIVGFCGQGGTSEGIRRANGSSHGQDLRPQPRYVERFGAANFSQVDSTDPTILRDAMRRTGAFLSIHSPPCKSYSSTRMRGEAADPPLIRETRAALREVGRLHVIENVVGATDELERSLLLRGEDFGEHVSRPRIFEANFPLVLDEALRVPGAALRALSCVGFRRRWRRLDPFGRPEMCDCCNGNLWAPQGDKPLRCSTVDCARAMGVDDDHMDYEGLAQAIPPVYAQYIFGQACMREVEREFGIPAITYDEMLANRSSARRKMRHWLRGAGGAAPDQGVEFAPSHGAEAGGEPVAAEPSAGGTERPTLGADRRAPEYRPLHGDASGDRVPPPTEGTVREAEWRELGYSWAGGYDQISDRGGAWEALSVVAPSRRLTERPGRAELLSLNSLVLGSGEWLRGQIEGWVSAAAEEGTRITVEARGWEAEARLRQAGFELVRRVRKGKAAYASGEAWAASSDPRSYWAIGAPATLGGKAFDYRAAEEWMDPLDRDGAEQEPKSAKAARSYAPIPWEKGRWDIGLPPELDRMMAHQGVGIYPWEEIGPSEVPFYPWVSDVGLVKSIAEADRAIVAGAMEYVPAHRMQEVQECSTVHPWTIVDQGGGKWRLCHDYSVGTNKHSPTAAFTLPSVWDVAPVVKPSSHFAKYDIRDGFWHVPIGEDSKKRLVVRHPGTGRLMWATRLPFGYLDSPRLFCGLTEALVARLRAKAAKARKGISFFVFVDDVLIVGDDEELTRLGMQWLEEEFSARGVQWAPHKKRGPCQCIEFLGLLLSNTSVARGVTITQKRLKKLTKEMEDWRAVDDGSAQIEVGPKELASILGKLVFVSQVVPGGRTYMQGMLAQFQGLVVDWSRGTVSAPHGGGRRMTVSRAFWRDLAWWRTHLATHSLTPFAKAEVRAEAALLGTDASGYGTGQVLWLDGGREESTLVFTAAEKRRPINWRELLGVVRACQLGGARLRGKVVLVETDNMAAYGAASKLASKSADMQELMRRLLRLSQKHGFTLRVTHTPGEKLDRPDQTSRGDAEEEPRARLSRRLFEQISSRWGPFTSYLGAEREYSAFEREAPIERRPSRRVWAHPTVSTVGTALRRVQEEMASGGLGNTQAVVVMPDDGGQAWEKLAHQGVVVGRLAASTHALEMNVLGQWQPCHANRPTRVMLFPRAAGSVPRRLMLSLREGATVVDRGGVASTAGAGYVQSECGTFLRLPVLPGSFLYSMPEDPSKDHGWLYQVSEREDEEVAERPDAVVLVSALLNNTKRAKQASNVPVWSVQHSQVRHEQHLSTLWSVDHLVSSFPKLVGKTFAAFTFDWRQANAEVKQAGGAFGDRETNGWEMVPDLMIVRDKDGDEVEEAAEWGDSPLASPEVLDVLSPMSGVDSGYAPFRAQPLARGERAADLPLSEGTEEHMCQGCGEHFGEGEPMEPLGPYWVHPESDSCRTECRQVIAHDEGVDRRAAERRSQADGSLEEVAAGLDRLHLGQSELKTGPEGMLAAREQYTRGGVRAGVEGPVTHRNQYGAMVCAGCDGVFGLGETTVTHGTALVHDVAGCKDILDSRMAAEAAAAMAEAARDSTVFYGVYSDEVGLSGVYTEWAEVEQVMSGDTADEEGARYEAHSSFAEAMEFVKQVTAIRASERVVIVGIAGSATKQTYASEKLSEQRLEAVRACIGGRCGHVFSPENTTLCRGGCGRSLHIGTCAGMGKGFAALGNFRCVDCRLIDLTEDPEEATEQMRGVAERTMVLELGQGSETASAAFAEYTRLEEQYVEGLGAILDDSGQRVGALRGVKLPRHNAEAFKNFLTWFASTPGRTRSLDSFMRSAGAFFTKLKLVDHTKAGDVKAHAKELIQSSGYEAEPSTACTPRMMIAIVGPIVDARFKAPFLRSRARVQVEAEGVGGCRIGEVTGGGDLHGLLANQSCILEDMEKPADAVDRVVVEYKLEHSKTGFSRYLDLAGTTKTSKIECARHLQEYWAEAGMKTRTTIRGGVKETRPDFWVVRVSLLGMTQTMLGRMLATISNFPKVKAYKSTGRVAMQRLIAQGPGSMQKRYVNVASGSSDEPELDAIVAELKRHGFEASKAPGPLLLSTTGGQWPKLTPMPMSTGSAFEPTKELLVAAAELAGADKSDPDPDLDTAYGREPKWTSHSLRRGADTAARQYKEETGATEAQIDIFFGWHEKILLKAMQVHYEGLSTRARMALAKITGWI